MNIRKSGSWLLVCAVMVAGALTGCSTSDEPEPDEPEVAATSSGEVPVFEGTPAEVSALMRACFEEHGITTVDDSYGGDGGFAFDNTSISPEELEAIDAACISEIGQPQMEGLSEERLRERYDARVEQWQCLIDEGYASGDPITFETFVEDYRRSGEQEVWEPTFDVVPDAPGSHSGGPSSACPRGDSW